MSLVALRSREDEVTKGGEVEIDEESRAKMNSFVTLLSDAVYLFS